jgi:hypothetical protein
MWRVSAIRMITFNLPTLNKANKSVQYIEFKRMDADLTTNWNSGEPCAADRHA